MTQAEAEQYLTQIGCEGWAPWVRDVFEVLPPGVTVVQVYQKWGTLRFDTEPEAPLALAELLEEIENASEMVCQVCGQPGSPRLDSGWIDTLCEAPACVARAQAT